MAMIDEIYVGDVRDGLRAMIAAGVKVQMVVTSPPYWALRDYGTGKWIGGDAACDHKKPKRNNDFNARYHGHDTKKKKQEVSHPMLDACSKCGAVREDKQIGLESSPRAYVETMVEVFGLVREVLSDDGTVWLNLGDSFANGGCGSRNEERWPKQSRNDHMPTHRKKLNMMRDGLKPKDKLLIPHRVAIALQDDGWWVRQDIVWSKRNPMPEAVTDRPTTAHEYVFLLSKSEVYYYNAEAIREPQTGNAHPRGDGLNKKSVPMGAVMGVKANDSFHSATSDYHESGDGKRNARSVWELVSQPYTDAHFAVFPAELAKRCILAGSRPGDVVLDIFMGSGTTANQAQQLGRHWAGIELNPEYAPLIRARTTGENGQMGLAL